MLDDDISRILLAFALLTGLGGVYSLITVSRDFQGRDRLLGWLTWFTFWSVLVFSAMEIDLSVYMIFVLAGLVSFFIKVSSGGKNKKGEK